ncbi:MAG: TolC family protein [Candidatus Rifleibacteriota bacterium]
MKLSYTSILVFILVAPFLSFSVYADEETITTNESPSKKLSLRQAFQKAAEFNPVLKAKKAELEVKSGQILQAGLLPNPVVHFEFEKFGGNGQFSGTKSMESSFSLSQELPVSGKNQKEQKLEKIGRQISESEFQAELLKIKIELTRVYLNLASLQKLKTIEEEDLKLSRENLEAVRKKSEAGEIPMLDLTRAKVELAAENTNYQKLIREIELNSLSLSNFWLESDADLVVADTLPCKSNLAPEWLEKVEEKIEQNPELTIAKKQLNAAKAKKSLEKAKSGLDIELEAGIFKSRADQKHSYFAGISLPLKIFDDNRGSIKSAAAQIKMQEQLLQKTEIDLRTRTISLKKQLKAISSEARSAREILVPGAKAAYEQIKRAYEEGERQLFEVFDARRILLEAQKACIQLETEELKLISELLLLTNQDELLFSILSQNESEINHD